MSENNGKELYLRSATKETLGWAKNFDEYIRQGEPAQRERADAWRVAIGLQAVDGLKTSEYLQQTARRNIEGEITIDEARELVKQYYVSKTTHDKDDADLLNRYLHIHPTKEWSVQPNLSPRTSTVQAPEQAPEQVRGLSHTHNPLVVGLIKVIGEEILSLSQLMEKTGLKHRPNFIEYHLKPAMKEGYVRLLYPTSPRHPRQKYLLTAKGMTLYQELMKDV